MRWTGAAQIGQGWFAVDRHLRVEGRHPMLAGDGVADGNLARAVQALDAVSGQGLAPALARAEGLFSAASAADREMWQSFVAWCRRILGRRLGERLPALVDDEETTMLAEALRERDEMKIDDGRRAGREEGQRVLLSSAAVPKRWLAKPAPSWRPFSLALRTPRNWRGSVR